MASKQSRRQHYLSRPKSETIPARVVCWTVDLARLVRFTAEGQTAFHDVLVNAVTLDYANGSYSIVDAADHCESPLFWPWMKKQLVGRKQTWAMSFNAAYNLAITGFWRLVEKQQWLLTNVDVKDSQQRQATPIKSPLGEHSSFTIKGNAGDKPEKSTWRGYCVLSDPPTIVVARPHYAPGTMKLVDVKNYGITSHPLDKQGNATPIALADWLATYVYAIQSAQLGSLQTTGASQAMHGFRHSYMSTPVLVHEDTKALSIERESLFAGRCECFRMGRAGGPIYHLDFNSFYPAVARDLEFPVRLAGCEDVDFPKLAAIKAAGYGVIADVTLATDAAAFPKRMEWGSIFPTGRFRTCLAGPELALATRMLAVAKVHRAAWYEMGPLFKEWTDTLWFLRNESKQLGNVPLEQCFKRLLVSLFGKFGQWDWGWIDSSEVEALDPFCQWYGVRPEEAFYKEDTATQPDNPIDLQLMPKSNWCRWRSIGWRVQYESVISEGNNSCPAITAWLYSAARCKLWEAICIAGMGNVLYCDADSLFVRQAGYSCLHRAGLIDNEKLGFLKVKEVLPWVRFNGIKHYETPTSQIHAGVPRHAKRTGQWSWEFSSGESLDHALNNLRPPKAMHFIRSYCGKSPYKHGRVTMNGNILPLILEE